MDAEIRKRLTVPFIVCLAILGINTNSIINGVRQHNNLRIAVAVISTLIVFGCFAVVWRNVGKKKDD